MPGKSNKVYVFESPIDAMSHATFFKLQNEDWKKDSRLSLGGLADLALDRYLAEHPSVTQVIFCLDNDYKETENHGQLAVRRMALKYSKQGYEVKKQVPQLPYKDFNEQLVAVMSELKKQYEGEREVGMCI